MCNLANRIAAVLIGVAAALPLSLPVWASEKVEVQESNNEVVRRDGRVVMINKRIPTVTQGPTWPPSTLADKDGNFVVVGSLLQRNEAGQVVRVLRQRALVSKDTVPPLDARGREDFSNPFGAPYKIIRHLDLSHGSPDRNMVLHTLSYGPPEGNFGGGPRVPRQGDSRYNLNSFASVSGVCREMFPAESQRLTYTIPSFPLHKAAIPGFLGDDVEYDVNTGQPFTPRLRNGEKCFPDGCLGEDHVHTRNPKPITLGDWLRAEVSVKVTLTGFNPAVNGYTRARFKVSAEHLIPNALYSVAVPRSSFFRGRPIQTIAQVPTVPSMVISDRGGKASFTMELDNPFPDPAVDDAGLRISAMSLIYRPDYTYLGGCLLRFAAGVDAIAVAASWGEGDFNFFGDLQTTAAP